jgi:BMFP domain-containing protein YqiC
MSSRLQDKTAFLKQSLQRNVNKFDFIKRRSFQAQWLMPAIPATLEAEMGRTAV